MVSKQSMKPVIQTALVCLPFTLFRCVHFLSCENRENGTIISTHHILVTQDHVCECCMHDLGGCKPFFSLLYAREWSRWRSTPVWVWSREFSSFLLALLHGRERRAKQWFSWELRMIFPLMKCRKRTSQLQGYLSGRWTWNARMG